MVHIIPQSFGLPATMPVCATVPAAVSLCKRRVLLHAEDSYCRSMDRDIIAPSRKADAARRQLGTALHLWLADLDPVSVHVLTCGGSEVANALAKTAGKPFSAFALEVHDQMTESDLRKLRNTFWNAMKHASYTNGSARDDEELLAAPLDADNEAHLSEGWYDLTQVMPVPIEAQTFILWFMAKHGNLDELGDWPDELFPDLRSLDPPRQKALLCEQIEVVRGNAEVMADPRTDTRPLILPPNCHTRRVPGRVPGTWRN